MAMTRTQLIDQLNNDVLPSLSDQQVQVILEAAKNLLVEDEDFELTEEELKELEMSKDDFKHGRTFSLEEAIDRINKKLGL